MIKSNKENENLHKSEQKHLTFAQKWTKIEVSDRKIKNVRMA